MDPKSVNGGSVGRKLPNSSQNVNIKDLITHVLKLCLIPLMAIFIFSKLKTEDFDFDFDFHFDKIWVHLLSTFVVFASTVFIMTRPRSVYLLDFSCYLPPSNLKAPIHKFIEHSKFIQEFDDSSLEFQQKILERSGLGDETYLPLVLHSIPPKPTMAAAREETQQVMFGALDNLFKNTEIDPREIGILVVNCGLFNPTPSLSSMIVNRYKLRGNIKNFNLGGMGCSASVIGIDLAKDMLQVHRNTYALVVSTENITQNSYLGNNKAMLVANCLFRIGGSAMLLSNKSRDRFRSKYKLVHTVRTHRGSDDKAFNCMTQEQDEEMKMGVFLSKDVMAIAGEALKDNITTLGPLVLPLSEQVMFVAQKLFKLKVKPYVPDFKLAFEHFCIHAGGKAVIGEIEKSLELSSIDVEASRMTLHRFGNTSSSSIWYELAYIEAKGRMKKGNRVWQIALGSGFKCNSAVWVALRDVKPSVNSPWEHCIDRYPVKLES